MKTLTATAQTRFDSLRAIVKHAGKQTIKQTAVLWGTSYNATARQLYWIDYCGYNTRELIRAERGGAHRPKKPPMDDGTDASVDASCLGDPTMPECPACRKAKRVSFHGRRPHLVQDKDGFIYCEACAYTPEFMLFEDKPLEVA